MPCVGSVKTTMGFLQQHQLSIMMIFSSICGLLAFFVVVTKTLSARRKRALIFLEIAVALLLISDRCAYIYRGDLSKIGYIMTWFCNFAVFYLTLAVLYGFNLYLIALLLDEGRMKKIPTRLTVCKVLIVIGQILIVISQFTHLYYYIDAMNTYHRESFYFISYVFPFIALCLQISAIIQFYKRLDYRVALSLILFAVLSMVSSFLQFLVRGVSLTTLTMAIFAVVIYIFSLLETNDRVEKVNDLEIKLLREEKRKARLLFEQTAESLVSAIDAKDKYTHGHSTRVAEYSKQLAEMAGKDPAECDEIYFAALLHDVGKIGISDSIINKEGKLTKEEFDQIKLHPVIGKRILLSISQSPYLSIGANYHHERYDGRGYPEGLKGEDIPEIARIIGVADAYDAMTSKRSYRDPLPQDKVREEFVKGMGLQFDPLYVKYMLQLIDRDSEYKMKEKVEVRELAGKDGLRCRAYRENFSEGIHLSQRRTKIHLHSVAEGIGDYTEFMPTMILYDALDGRIHDDPKKIQELLYLEYGEFRLDGHSVRGVARKIRTVIKDGSSDMIDWAKANRQGVDYDIEVVKVKDHVLIKIDNEFQKVETTVALLDNIRFAYIGFTGQNCYISDVDISTEEETVSDDLVERIAEEVSYVNGPRGDIDNLQINGWRTEVTEGVLVTDGMKITFHTMSLPTSRLVWHCPYIVLYYSDDKKVNGTNYREFALIRLDGESWNMDSSADNKIFVYKDQDFRDWDAWKKKNKEGVDCEVTIAMEGNLITVFTDENGLKIKNVTTINGSYPCAYVAITGDQVALTNIHITRKEEQVPVAF